MDYSILEVTVPNKVKKFIAASKTMDNVLMNALILYPYIADRIISHGYAAEMLGISKMRLIELYAAVGIPYFDMNEEEFKKELKIFDEVVGAVV
ncbi:MAG: UPF0175 family protein [Spirochaetales bacterium]|jgi:predicted HTH domain antitoxin|nr:UPF0175 family protein [Spirochaetales bacterium]MBR6200798.1 UPF0175 family protein [Spirochaetales bacterium]